MNILAISLSPRVSIISLGIPRLADRLSESKPSAVSLNSSKAEENNKKNNKKIQRGHFHHQDLNLRKNRILRTVQSCDRR